MRVFNKYYVTDVVKLGPNFEEMMAARSRRHVRCVRAPPGPNLTDSQKRDARLPYHIRDLNTLQGKLFEHYIYCKPRSFNREKKLTSLQQRMRLLVTLTPLEKYKELAEHLPKLTVSLKSKPRLRFNINTLRSRPHYNSKTKVLRWFLRPAYFNVAPLRRLRSYPSLVKLANLMYGARRPWYHRRRRRMMRRRRRRHQRMKHASRKKKARKLRVVRLNVIRQRRKRRKRNRKIRVTVGRSFSTVKYWKVRKEAIRKVNLDIRMRDAVEPIANEDVYLNVPKKHAEAMQPYNVALRLPRKAIRQAIRGIVADRQAPTSRRARTPSSEGSRTTLATRGINVRTHPRKACVGGTKNARYHEYKRNLKRLLKMLTPRGYIVKFISKKGINAAQRQR